MRKFYWNKKIFNVKKLGAARPQNIKKFEENTCERNNKNNTYMRASNLHKYTQLRIKCRIKYRIKYLYIYITFITVLLHLCCVCYML